MDDKHALKVTSAGIRLIALFTIFNTQDLNRLRQYIADSYHPDLLAESDAESRAQAFAALFEESGKLKVRQVIGVSKEHVIILMASQSGEDYLVDVQVGAEYPHYLLRVKVDLLEGEDDDE